jgi:hypothetical protein
VHSVLLCCFLQPYAELFGLRCNIPTSHTLNFSEEVVRDQALFVGSLLAAELEPRLRQAAGASSWQVRSLAPQSVATFWSYNQQVLYDG